MPSPQPANLVGRAVRRWGIGSLLVTVALCALAWGVVALGCLCVGSSTTGFHWPAAETRHLRLAYVLPASLIGGALASAGVAYQAVLRNPLADPYLLGVSSGASLAAYLWRLTPTAALAAAAAVAGQQAFALAGAVASVAVVFALATRRGRLERVTLLLVGVIVNAVNGSIFLLVNAVDVDRAGPNGGAISFLVGGIQPDLTTVELRAATIAVAAGWVVLLYLAGQLNAAGLDETEAAALGLRIHRLRWAALGVASAMTAAAVAISGPIGFVGLICPHVARRLVGPDPRRSLPVATAAGAILLAVADGASRLLSSPDYAGTLLPVGVLTGLLGGPFFLLLLWQSRRRLD